MRRSVLCFFNTDTSKFVVCVFVYSVRVVLRVVYLTIATTSNEKQPESDTLVVLYRWSAGTDGKDEFTQFPGKCNLCDHEYDVNDGSSNYQADILLQTLSVQY